MATDTRGYVTVAEAAKRLDLSEEQVRRRLRGGKLRGHRVGNHWLVPERALEAPSLERPEDPMFSDESITEIHRLQDEVAEYRKAQGMGPIDVLELIRRHRGED